MLRQRTLISLVKTRLSLVGTLAVAFVAFSSGCARTATTTEVRPDGSLLRTVAFKGNSPEPKKGAEGASGGEMSASFGPKLEDMLAVPKGAEWTIIRSRKDDELTITATRTVAAGQPVGDDLGIRSTPEPAKPTSNPPSAGAKPVAGKKPPAATAKPAPSPALLLSNTVTVRTLPSGRMEYREVIRWRGKKPNELETATPELAVALKKALPASIASDATVINRLGAAMQREMWSLIFGPGDPLLSLVLFHQDLAEFRIQKRLGQTVEKTLATELGNRMSETERKETVRKMVALMTDQGLNQVKSKANAGPGGPPPSAEGGNDMGQSVPISMLFRVRMPGKVVATNGELDENTGEVVWAMYSMAPAAGDVTLTAECEVSK